MLQFFVIAEKSPSEISNLTPEIRFDVSPCALLVSMVQVTYKAAYIFKMGSELLH